MTELLVKGLESIADLGEFNEEANSLRELGIADRFNDLLRRTKALAGKRLVSAQKCVQKGIHLLNYAYHLQEVQAVNAYERGHTPPRLIEYSELGGMLYSVAGLNVLR